MHARASRTDGPGRFVKKEAPLMGNETDWARVVTIMVRGFGAVFAIMVILAAATTLVGKLLQKFDKPKEEQGGAS